MNTASLLPARFWLVAVAASSLASAGGCSSVIGSAYLREAWIDAVEHAAETRAAAKAEAASRGPADAAAPRGDDEDMAAGAADGPAKGDVGDDAEPEAEAAGRRRYATLDEAVADADRLLARAGGLTAAARDTLASMLETVPKQDWPVVVDEFTASLAAAPPPARPEQVAEPVSVSEPVPAAAAVPLPPLPPSQPEAAAVPVPPAAPAAAAVAAVQEPTEAAAPAPPLLTVENACFATRVRGWGAVDRFAASRFTPGQDVIVYFELDHLATHESADGHTTRVDTRLKLVGPDGRKVHEWTFEPLEETCRSRRRDYFARYVVAIPEAAPAGTCQFEISVTDSVGGHTAQATLPLEVLVR